MSEDNGSGNLESQAKELGWVPKEQFRGPEDKFVDAGTFIAESERVMPHLRRTNESLRGELTQVRGTLTKMESALTESQATIKDMATGYEEIMKDRIQAAKKKLYEEIASARKDDDLQGEVAAQEELNRLNMAEVTAKEKPAARQQERKAPPGDGAIDPAVQAFVDQNAWYGGASAEDKRRTRLFQVAFAEARSDKPHLTPQQLLSAAKETMEADLRAAGRETPGADRVGGGGGGSGGYGGGGSGRSYADLPADAKEKCAQQSPRFVGENKRHKTMKDWQDAYARIYFTE